MTEHETDVEMAAVSDGAYALVVADFADTGSAWEAYESLKSAEGRTFRLDGVLVVKREPGGDLEILKATDHSTRRGLRWGVVGGVALGLIFPPSVLGGAAALGAIGAATGKGVELHRRKVLADELGDAVQPGHSGIVALVSDPAAVELRKALGKAAAIAEKAIAKADAEEIKAAADEASTDEA